MEVCTCIVPCFNEEEAIPYYYEEMQKVMQKVPELDFELLFVDDGSCDGTLKGLKELAQKDSGVRYISFSRNFGKEAALYAGLQNAGGDYAVTMDVDLQDPPSLEW